MPSRNDWAVVLDMDGTLIPKDAGALMRLMTDLLADSHDEARKDVERIRGAYASMFTAGYLSDDEYRAWLLEEFRLYVRYGLHRDAWRTVTSRVPLKDEAAETVRALHAAGIPTCVISAASADFAEHVLEMHGLLPHVDAVYAGRLIHHDDVIVGWEDTTIVSVGNKGDWSRHFADAHGVPHERILAVGDSPGDATIGHLKEHRLLLAKDDEEAAVLRSLGFADEIIVTHSFGPAADWLRNRIGLPR